MERTFKRLIILGGVIIGTMLIVGGTAIGFLKLKGPFIFNLTESQPRGLYKVIKPGELHRDDLVLVQPSPELEQLMIERDYLPAGWPIIKPIAALAGDHVCVTEFWVHINGVNMTTDAKSMPLDVDTQGRPLPQWRDCRALAANEVFLFSIHSERSLDSRYFGPVDRSQIIGQARLYWGWE